MLNSHGPTSCTTENFSGYTELITSVKIVYIQGAQTQVPMYVWHTRFGIVAPNISR